jgi:hypothetical protein
MIPYIKLFIYSCVFCIVLGFLLIGGGIIYLYNKRILLFPVYHVERIVVFGYSWLCDYTGHNSF